MDRIKHLDMADDAVLRAEDIAREAQRAVEDGDSLGRIPRLTAVGAVWADIARAHAAIAAALPETKTEA